MAAALALLFVAAGGPLGAGQGGSYDLVILNGRVLDPESGLDAVRHLGVRGGKIAAVSPEPLPGQIAIDASGLVVAPGFMHQCAT